jgi:hypothetical protein
MSIPYRAIASTALRYGTFWPGALAYDAYKMYKKRRRSDKGYGGNQYHKRKFLRRPRPYRPVMRKRLNTSKKASNKWSRWKRTIRSIPSTRVKPFRFFRYPLADPSRVGAQLATGCLTDIPFASRTLNNILIKSFDINLQFMPVQGCDRPTFVRFALVVQTGPYSAPTAAQLLHGYSHTNNFIDMGTTQDGWMNRNFAINPNYRVIYAKTLMMAPLLEAGATSVQSNLNAQCRIKQRVNYHKYLQYDDSTETVGEANNVFYMYWFDDDFRIAGVASTTTHRVIGDINTNYRYTEF